MLGIVPLLVCTRVYYGVYTAPCTTLGTPLRPPCWLQYTSRVYLRARLTALTHHVAEANISDEGFTVTPRVPLSLPVSLLG